MTEFRLDPDQFRALLALEIYKLYIQTETDDVSHEDAFQEAETFLSTLHPSACGEPESPIRTKIVDLIQERDALLARAEKAEVEAKEWKRRRDHSDNLFIKEQSRADALEKALGVKETLISELEEVITQRERAIGVWKQEELDWNAERDALKAELQSALEAKLASAESRIQELESDNRAHLEAMDHYREEYFYERRRVSSARREGVEKGIRWASDNRPCRDVWDPSIADYIARGLRECEGEK